MHDITVGKGCTVYFGNTGKTTRTGISPVAGTFDFKDIIVAAGGEVTSTSDLTGIKDVINIKVPK